jgi:hypothetical protein
MRHDIGMTTPAVWISTTTSEVTFDNDTPGNYWELVGTINTAEEADLSKHIKVLPNLRSTAPRISRFYFERRPRQRLGSSSQDPAGQPSFWIAIDPWGRMRPYIHGARETYFVSTEKATVTKSLTRRPPEPHPGETIKPVMIGIRVKRNDNGLFTPRENR